MRHPYYVSTKDEQRDEAIERVKEEARRYLDRPRKRITGRVLRDLTAAN